MTRTKYRDIAIVENVQGNLVVVPYPTITVYNAGTTTPISQQLYDASGATLPNPFDGEEDGTYEFFINNPQQVKIEINPNDSEIETRILDYENVGALTRIGVQNTLLSVGEPLLANEIGLEFGYDPDIMDGAVTVTAKNNTVDTVLHFNPVAVGADPKNKTVNFGAHLPGYGDPVDYVVGIFYANDEINWGGLLIDCESLDVSAGDGADINTFKSILTVRSPNSNARSRNMEIQCVRYNAQGLPGTKPLANTMRGQDVGMFIGADLDEGTHPWMYCAYAAFNNDYWYPVRSANAGFYAGGGVSNSLGTDLPGPGWEHGFYHDRRNPSDSNPCDPAFYTHPDFTYIKDMLRIGIDATPSEAIHVFFNDHNNRINALLQNGAGTLALGDVNSHAYWWARTGGDDGGNPGIRMTIDGRTDWVMSLANPITTPFHDPLTFSFSDVAGSNDVMSMDKGGNVIVGTAALTTTATDGRLYIPTSAGAPTGIPSAYSGRVPLHFDTTNNKLWVYDGGWIGIVLS